MTFSSIILYALRLVFPSKHCDLGSGRKSLFGAMFCIGISLVPLVAVLTVTDGMIQGITGRIIGLSTGDISVRVPYYIDGDTFPEKISLVEGVKSSYAELQGIALAAGKKTRAGATVRCVQKDIFTLNEAFSSYFTFVEGSKDFATNRTAIIGQKIATDLNLHVGDSFSLITSVQSKTGSFIPKAWVFTVGAIISCGYQELDSLWVFIPYQTGASFFSASSTKKIITVVTDKAFSVELEQIRQSIKNSINDEGVVYTWNEINASQYENFASTKALLLLIMLLIVLVASINISSALIMLVMEKRKEIAILKSVGASSYGISVAFLLAGFFAGLVGVFIGVPLGLFASLNINLIIAFTEKIVNNAILIFYSICGDSSYFDTVHLLDPAYYLQQIPIVIPFKELFIIVLGTLLLSLFVSVIPAIKAGREKPLETLRKA